MDSLWADQCDTDGENPCDSNYTTMEFSPDGAYVY
jgi:hypothetical protein